MVKRSTLLKRNKGQAIYTTPVKSDALKASKKMGKGFYVRKRWTGAYSVFQKALSYVIDPITGEGKFFYDYGRNK